MQFLFVMDPVESMLPDKDTTFAFIRGATARGHQAWHCLPRDIWTLDKQVYAQATQICVNDNAPHVTLGKVTELQVSLIDAVFVRKDPPFDSNYLYLTQLLDLVCSSTLVVNSPQGLRDANEKLFALQFDS